MSDIILEKINHTALLTFNRLSKKNALCADFLKKIDDAIDKVENDDEIYTLILTGAENVFIAGADISEMVDMTSEEILEWSALGSNLNLRLEALPIPVIAAVNGYALGGGFELALACDIRLASEKAVFGLPETRLGVICGAGGTVRLARLIGAGLAKELIFTGRSIDAQEALSLGIVNRLVPHQELFDEALKLALSIQRNGQLAVRAAKKAINNAPNEENPYIYERQLFSDLFKTEDQKIGMRGFLNKEKNIIFRNK